MPRFIYVGSRGEHIVGIPEGDISEEEYEALDYDHQQAVYINKGSDGGALYQEVHEDAPVAEAAEPEVAAPAAAVVSADIPDSSAPAAEPDLNQPLDEPAEGAN